MGRTHSAGTGFRRTAFAVAGLTALTVALGPRLPLHPAPADTPQIVGDTQARQALSGQRSLAGQISASSVTYRASATSIDLVQTFTVPAGECSWTWRAWANDPDRVAGGGRLVVRSATVSDASGTRRAKLTAIRLGGSASAPGAYRVTAPACDHVTRVSLHAAATWPRTPMRDIGASGATRWWTSVWLAPAWAVDEKGRRLTLAAPVRRGPGETATSPLVQVESITVVSPKTWGVPAVPAPIETTGVSGSVRVTRTGPAQLRDTPVAFGVPARVRTDVGSGVVLETAAPNLGQARTWAALAARSYRSIAPHFGKLPPGVYRMWAALPNGTGLELGSTVLVGGTPALGLAAHEAGHWWLPGYAATDQDREPWLDEAMATLAQTYAGAPLPTQARPALASKVTLPMAHWSARSNDQFHEVVYSTGAWLLQRARAQQPSRFDAAVRQWIAGSRGGVTDAAALKAALARAGAGRSLAVLRSAGI